jgi:paraquat-inducible protein A
MMNDEDLDQLIICKKCHTVHKKVAIGEKKKAFCSNCNVLLYRQDEHIVDKTLALVIAATLSLFIAFNFTIITINIQGLEQSLTLASLFIVMAEHREFVVGLLFLFIIFFFPIMILSSTFILLLFMKLEKGAYLTKRLLILLAHLKPWSMVDIFFISLLISMVKLFDIANIELGIAFVAFVFTLILDIIITKNLSFYELWEIHTRIYGKQNEE